MTPEPTAAAPEHIRPVPFEARHEHNRACFWDVDECRWQCATSPAVRYSLDRCTAIGRPVTHPDPEAGP